jgi:predicted outer membrane repeat protein
VPEDQPTIAYAVAAASSGDSVLVSEGIYYEHDITIAQDIALVGATGDPGDVVIDAEQLGRVLAFAGVGRAASVSGFTITGGFASPGGGVYCDYASPTFTDVLIEGNQTADYDLGGGMYCLHSSPYFHDVRFVGNTAERNGGGLYCIYSTPALLHVDFEGNAAGVHGGGMYCATSPLSLDQVTFTANTAGDHGGGLFCVHSSGLAYGISFAHNDAGSRGGAIHCSDSSPDIIDSIFWANSAGSCGGAVSCIASSDLSLTAATMASNSAAESGGAIFLEDSSPTLGRSILAFSSSGGGVYAVGLSSPTLHCCDVFGNTSTNYGGSLPDQTGISGNISADPLFCDLGSGDLQISEWSPCLAENNECDVQVGALGAGCGAVPVVRSTFGAIKALFLDPSCPPN